MKRYTLTFAQNLDYQHPHPERTAMRCGTGLDFDCYFQVWPNRQSMLKTCEMQARSGTHRPWKPLIRVEDEPYYQSLLKKASQ